MKRRLVTVVKSAEVEVNPDWAFSVVASAMPDDVSALSEDEVAEAYVQLLLQRGADLGFETFVSCVTELEDT